MTGQSSMETRTLVLTVTTCRGLKSVPACPSPCPHDAVTPAGGHECVDTVSFSVTC